MRQTLILETIILVDNRGHMESFTLHSQQNEIIDFIANNPNHYKPLPDTAELKKADYEDFRTFLKESIIRRGLAELSSIRYSPKPDDPF